MADTAPVKTPLKLKENMKKNTNEARPNYKNKRVMLLSTGEIKRVPYPIDNTLIMRNRAILVLDEEG